MHKMKGLSMDGSQIILFVIGAIIAVTALSTLLTGDAIEDYYDANTQLETNTNVSPLLILIATFVPIGIFISILGYFFRR